MSRGRIYFWKSFADKRDRESVQEDRREGLSKRVTYFLKVPDFGTYEGARKHYVCSVTFWTGNCTSKSYGQVLYHAFSLRIINVFRRPFFKCLLSFTKNKCNSLHRFGTMDETHQKRSKNPWNSYKLIVQIPKRKTWRLIYWILQCTRPQNRLGDETN